MVQFKIFYRNKNKKTVTFTFASLNEAQATAKDLSSHYGTVFLDANIDQSHSGSLAKYKQGEFEILNKGFLNIVLKEMGAF